MEVRRQEPGARRKGLNYESTKKGKHKKRIGIVGAGITEAELLAKSDGYDLWSVNNLYGRFPETRFSAWFELHDIRRIRGRFYRRMRPNYPVSGDQTVREYLKQIDRLRVPIYMQKKWKEVKNSTPFPFEALMTKYGTYWGCSFAWMTAFAMEMKVQQIAYLGVLLTGNEYYYQRPSVEYLIGRAQERGIDITVDESSDLLKASYMYAWKENFDQIYLLHGDFVKDMAMEVVTALSSRLEKMYGSPF